MRYFATFTRLPWSFSRFNVGSHTRTFLLTVDVCAPTTAYLVYIGHFSLVPEPPVLPSDSEDAATHRKKMMLQAILVCSRQAQFLLSHFLSAALRLRSTRTPGQCVVRCPCAVRAVRHHDFA